MSQGELSGSRERQSPPPRRSLSNLTAFVFGIPAALAFLAAVRRGPLHDTVLERYFRHHVEAVEVLLFCCAMGALLGKVIGWWMEKRAARQEILPEWDGQPVPASEAGGLLDNLQHLGRQVRNSCLGRRITNVLEFVRSRGSANDLDDQMRCLADTDAAAMDSSYSLTRFITWAIPILGFLGTVLGITDSIANVSPESLEKDMSQVTNGLALAFDATAVALALTMVTMFMTFLVERMEEGLILSVDRFVDDELAHRFERGGRGEGGDFLGALRQNSQVLLKTSEKLVVQQVEVWGKALTEMQRFSAESGRAQQQVMAGALKEAMEQTLEAHSRRLAEVEKRSAAQGAAMLEKLGSMADLIHAVNAQTQTLAQLEAGAGQVLQLQETLQQNLANLASAGSFEQAVHTLTAAIHLLTARASATAAAPPSPNRLGTRPGTAA